MGDSTVAVCAWGSSQATIEAFKLGYHVLSEKPLAKKVADVDRILAAEQVRTPCVAHH